MVMRALSSEAHFAMPQLARFVERREMSTIVRAIELGEDYIVVDGGNRVGKSIAVKVAASRLSAKRTVRWSVCGEGGTAALVLRGLYGLDTQTTSLLRIISGVAFVVSQPRSGPSQKCSMCLSKSTSLLLPLEKACSWTRSWYERM